MEIILSKQCLALVGMLERGLGYYIRSTKTGRFFGQRSRHSVPPDGHWRFIVLCAEMARNRLYITDIEVTAGELDDALEEATNGQLQSPWAPRDAVVNAKRVLDLKKELGL